MPTLVGVYQSFLSSHTGDMKNTNTPPSKKTPLATAINFAGFGNWFEVFRAGTQTDSKGREQTFTQDDLDSIIANHSADNAAPLVVGHPKTNDPAYGWTSGLKREGDVLLAKASDVVAEFEQAVRNKNYPKRSISILPDGHGGYQLRHIGFLGAARPAVEGLKDLSFSETPNETIFEFSAAVETAYGFSSIRRVFSGLRDLLIEKYGREEADNAIPDYALSGLDRTAQELETPEEPKLAQYSQEETPVPDPKEEKTKQFSQADLDAAVDAATQKAKDEKDALETQLAQQQFNARIADAKERVGKAMKDGCLLPAQADGWVEFLASLPGDAEQAFEFSAADNQTVKKSPLEFAQEHLSKLGKQIELGEHDMGDDPKTPEMQYSAPSGTTANAERVELHNKALEYQATNKCTYIEAVQAVEKEI